MTSPPEVAVEAIAESGEAPLARPKLSPLARGVRLLFASGVTTWFIFAFQTTPSDAPGWTVCPTRLITSYPCPSCGFGRAFIAIAHGEWMEALRLNIWSPVTFVAAAAVALWLYVEVATGLNWIDPTLKRWRRAVYIGVVVMIVVRYAGLWLLS